MITQKHATGRKRRLKSEKRRNAFEKHASLVNPQYTDMLVMAEQRNLRQNAQRAVSIALKDLSSYSRPGKVCRHDVLYADSKKKQENLDHLRRERLQNILKRFSQVNTLPLSENMVLDMKRKASRRIFHGLLQSASSNQARRTAVTDDDSILKVIKPSRQTQIFRDRRDDSIYQKLTKTLCQRWSRRYNGLFSMFRDFIISKVLGPVLDMHRSEVLTFQEFDDILNLVCFLLLNTQSALKGQKELSSSARRFPLGRLLATYTYSKSAKNPKTEVEEQTPSFKPQVLYPKRLAGKRDLCSYLR